MPRRYEALDGLRGIAAVAVVTFHMFQWWSPSDFRYAFNPQGLVFTHWLPSFRGSFLAVDLFFILSGFVIAAAYKVRIKSYTEAWNFLMKRFFRVYPMHFAVLLAMLCGAWATHGMDLEFQDNYPASYFISGLLFLNGWLLPAAATWNPPNWSISCEFVAYVLFSCAAWMGYLRSRLAVACAAVLGAACYVTIAVIWRDKFDLILHAAIVRALAGFAIGVWLHQIASSRPNAPVGFWHAEIIVAGAMVGSTFLTGSWPLLFVAFAAPLIALLQSDSGPVARILRMSVPQFLGEISYSIYIVHWPILVIITALLKSNQIIISNYWVGDIFALLTLLTVVSVSFLTYRFIESPWREFGRNCIFGSK